MRLESEFNGDLQGIKQFQQAFADGPAEKYQMTWSLYPQDKETKDGTVCLQIRSLPV